MVLTEADTVTGETPETPMKTLTLVGVKVRLLKLVISKSLSILKMR